MPQDLSSFYRTKRILVTGGAGFVGSNLTHFLVEASAQVTVVDNFHPNYGANKFNLDSIARKIKLVQGDITDRALMISLVRESDLIFHAAAQCSHVDSMIDPWLDL